MKTKIHTQKDIGLHKTHEMWGGGGTYNFKQWTEQRIHCSKLAILLFANWQRWSFSVFQKTLDILFRSIFFFFRHHFVCSVKFFSLLCFMKNRNKFQRLLAFKVFAKFVWYNYKLFILFIQFKIHWLSILNTLLFERIILMKINYNMQISKKMFVEWDVRAKFLAEKNLCHATLWPTNSMGNYVVNLKFSKHTNGWLVRNIGKKNTCTWKMREKNEHVIVFDCIIYAVFGL